MIVTLFARISNAERMSTPLITVPERVIVVGPVYAANRVTPAARHPVDAAVGNPVTAGTITGGLTFGAAVVFGTAVVFGAVAVFGVVDGFAAVTVATGLGVAFVIGAVTAPGVLVGADDATTLGATLGADRTVGTDPAAWSPEPDRSTAAPDSVNNAANATATPSTGPRGSPDSHERNGA